MANFTKKAIEGSFVKLLEERPLSKITVKDLVADCGINRNTFYYYFEDIPELIENMVEAEAQLIIQAYPTVEKFEDCLETVIDRGLKNKRAVLHIYHSSSREIFEHYMWRVCDHVIHAYVTSVLGERVIDESDRKVIESFLSSLAFGIVSNWLKNDMSDDIRDMFARLTVLKKEMVEQLLSQ